MNAPDRASVFGEKLFAGALGGFARLVLDGEVGAEVGKKACSVLGSLQILLE